MPVRALICLALLGATLLGIEWHYGRELAAFQGAGGVLPPFADHRSPGRLEALRAKIELNRQEPNTSPKGAFDQRYGWINRPGNFQEQGNKYAINSIGARGWLEFAEEPAEGVHRVICLGDSFTYGSEVRDGQDWPSVIDQGSEEFEVINLGVGGWALDQSYLRWQDQGQHLEPDVVLIGMFIGSIGRHVNRFRPLLYPNDDTPAVKPRFRLEGKQLVLVPQPFTSRLAVLEAWEAGTLLDTLEEHEFFAGDRPALGWSNLSTLLASRRAHQRRDVPHIYADEDGEPFKVTVALCRALTAEARAAGAEPLVLLFPRKDDFVYDLASWEESAYWRTLTRALDAESIPYLDLYGLVAAAGGAQLYGREHLDAAGNALVAGRVAAWLAERPSSH